jgi:hypothetical protein
VIDTDLLSPPDGSYPPDKDEDPRLPETLEVGEWGRIRKGVHTGRVGKVLSVSLKGNGSEHSYVLDMADGTGRRRFFASTVERNLR